MARQPVPLDGVIDLTALGGDFVRDPYPYYAGLRERGPVHPIRLRSGAEGWLIVGHDAVRAAFGDSRLTKDWSKVAPPGVKARPEDALGTHLLRSDPPEHTRLRKLVAKEFTARRIARLEPRVQRITDELLDALLATPERRADLVDALSYPLPITVICELLGVPFLDRVSFRDWSNELLGPRTPETHEAALTAMAGYLGELISAKRTRTGDDLLSALIRTRDEEGDQLSDDELLGMAFLLLVAGHETTVNLISNTTLLLLRHPAQLAALRADVGLLDAAIEETLRYDGPVERATLRYVLEPFRIGTTTLRRGDPVLLSLASAGRDPSRHPDPDRFDIQREPRPHLNFGHGIHFCIGAPLARLEARIALSGLLARCPGLALDTESEEIRWRVSMIVRGPLRLPVRW